MDTEFRTADVGAELRSLLAFDRKVFAAGDRFPAAYWRTLEAYWLLVKGMKAGCCAFRSHVDFQEDLDEEDGLPAQRGCLYIATTGILPRFQGAGFGTLMKAWQICYARRNRFERVVTNTRKGNATMIGLNKKFGFQVVRTTRGYYAEPKEATVVLELKLGGGLGGDGYTRG